MAVSLPLPSLLPLLPFTTIHEHHANVKLTTFPGDINDFACHCANPEKIGIHIAPCLEMQTNCTTSDLMAFSTAVNSVCTFEASINSTVTWTNQTGSGPPGGHSGPSSNSSGGYGGYSGGGYGGSPTGPAVAVYTGAASSVRSAGAGLVVVAAVAMFAL